MGQRIEAEDEEERPKADCLPSCVCCWRQRPTGPVAFNQHRDSAPKRLVLCGVQRGLRVQHS